MRTQWVGANAYFNLSVGNNGADGVYNCKNGYLINKPILDTDTLESNVQTIADFAKSVDVPVTVTLVPSTGYIANDVLPAVHDTYTDDENRERTESTYRKRCGFCGFAFRIQKCLCKRHAALLQNRPSLDNGRCIYGLYGNMQVARNNPCRQEPVYC